ncbi:MAG: TonB C-terminal domain-containing protein [Prosthecobacter sp.]
MKRRRPATLEPLAASAFVIIALHVAITAGLLWWWQSQQARQSSTSKALAWLNPGDFKSAPSSQGPSSAPAAAPQQRPGPVPKTIATADAPKAIPLEPPPVPAPSPPPPPASAEPPVQKATLVAPPPDQHRMEPAPNDGSAPLFAPATPAPKPSANRSITLRRMRSKPTTPAAGKSPAPPMSSPTLLDIARLNTLRPGSPPKPGASAVTDDNDNNTGLDAVDEAMNTAFLAVWTAPPIDAVPATQREARLNISLGKDGSVLKSQMSKFSGSHVLDQSILEAAANVKKIPVTLPANYTKDSYDVELNFLLLP